MRKSSFLTSSLHQHHSVSVWCRLVTRQASRWLNAAWGVAFHWANSQIKLIVRCGCHCECWYIGRIPSTIAGFIDLSNGLLPHHLCMDLSLCQVMWSVQLISSCGKHVTGRRTDRHQHHHDYCYTIHINCYYVTNVFQISDVGSDGTFCWFQCYGNHYWWFLMLIMYDINQYGGIFFGSSKPEEIDSVSILFTAAVVCFEIALCLIVLSY